MSLSNSSDYGPELYTATVTDQLNTGGSTVDVEQLQARDDRRIVGVNLSLNGDQGFVELSMSSTTNLSGSQVNEDRSGTIAMGHDTQLFFDEQLWYDWGEGEEIHIHEKNNTGATIAYSVTIYYVEADDC